MKSTSIKCKHILLVFTTTLLLLNTVLTAQVHINPPFSMPDVNIVQYGDRAYAFCGTDLEPYNFDTATFIMPYWRCFSSSDLINWEFESMLRPEDTYIGESSKCFAGHGVVKNDKWYWYFSNFITNTGVATSDSPKGPWKDALGKPLLPEDISACKEYDGCVFTDDDGRSYMIYGGWKNRKFSYHIVELGDDMISLKETPKPLEVDTVPIGNGYVPPVDAPFMHKHNGLYYLSWRIPYAVSDNIYGPYKLMGKQDAHGHLGFFTFNNQWFVNYTSLKEGYRRRYRFCSFAYVHFNDDGSIAPIEPLIKEHGVGQYNAKWPAIEAEWYMNIPEGPIKKMLADGNFVLANIKSDDYAYYPNIHDCEYNAALEIKYASKTKAGGTIIAKAYAENGPEIGRVNFAPTKSWDEYGTVTLQLDKTPPGKLSIMLVFEGDSKNELIHLDSFKVLGTQE